MSPIQLTFLLLVLYAITRPTETQWELIRAVSTEICVTDFGNSGICVRLENCPAAIELIGQRGRPTLCGFDYFEPIVCCELTYNDNVVSKSVEYGSIAKRKCAEYVSDAATTTTTVPPPSGPISLGISPFVIGGVDAFPLEFPHMAILGYGTEDDIQWKCGGSLISEKFVITAAHCIYSRLGKVAFVNLGLHEISQITLHIQTFTVKNTYQYPEYVSNQHYHDIALIELNGEANIRASVKPACLQTEKEIENPILTATGWGAIEFAGDINDVLQKVNLTSIPFEMCTRSYQPQVQLRNGLMDDMHLCAGSLESRADTCQGDSGGPLQYKIDGSKLYTIVGVTSFGIKCGLLPSVYTRVSNYVSWIEGIVWPNDV